ncbi:uncharacterized protein LOC115209332 [Octopus sinensis]|uniref:Uncharacterized protein LOC115209332 n=1 Tax=Octopus sinensis TaxID=2607531 RepID=A0A7E6ERB8_9MOLL|nr:uncharacterized protein LOC115209332 [Octopus sinensis]
MGRFKKYLNETEKQEAKKVRERERRANETNDERLERLRKLSFNAQKRRAEETSEERKQRLRRLSQNELKRRAKETKEERYERLRKLAQYARNRRATGSKNHNTRQGKKIQEEKQNANGYIKVNLLKYYDVQEFHHQEEMQHNPGNNISRLKTSRLDCASTLQLHQTHANNVQNLNEMSSSQWKRKASEAATIRIEDVTPDTNFKQTNSKASKTRRSTSHSMTDEVIVFPQSAVSPVQERHVLVVPNHQTAVMSNLFSLWKARRLCDSYISNGTINVMIHKMVLGAVCPKLLPVLHHSSKGSFPNVVFPSSVSKEGLLAFAEYMYSGILDLNEEILVQLKTIAEKLEMKDFEDLCCKELNKAKTKDILSGVVEPLLAEPCSLSGLFPSRTQGDPNEVQNSMFMKLFRNNYSNINMQADVSVTTTSVSDVRSAENMVTDQIVDIKTEVEPVIQAATKYNSLQLKIEPCSLGESQNSIQEELCIDIGNITAINNDVQLKPAASTTSGKVINRDNDFGVSHSNKHLDSSDVIYISEDTCLSQHSENCDNDTDDQDEVQLISVTSVTGNIIEDNLSNNSDLVEISSTLPTNTKWLQTSNSKPCPVNLFSVNDSGYSTL